MKHPRIKISNKFIFALAILALMILIALFIINPKHIVRALEDTTTTTIPDTSTTTTTTTTTIPDTTTTTTPDTTTTTTTTTEPSASTTTTTEPSASTTTTTTIPNTTTTTTTTTTESSPTTTTTYQRTPNGISITSPVNFKISMDEYIGVGYDSGCNIGTASKTYYNGTPYWGLAFLNKDRSDFIAISDELVPSTTLSHTFTKNFPAGTQIGEIIFICSETPNISFDNWYLTQYTGNDLEILNPANPITITTVSTSSTSQ